MPIDLHKAASEPFYFYTGVHLQGLTGLRAKNIQELLSIIQSAPDAVIYHHTHHFLQQHQCLSPEPPNDFAYWVSAALSENELGEKLASINTCEFASIGLLRDKIASALSSYLAKAKKPLKEANAGQEFCFIKSISFVFKTPYAAHTLDEFINILQKVSIHSIYFHMFEAKLRLGKGTNDFSKWFENALEDKALAKKIERLDPYTHTMESLREKIIRLISV